MNKLINIKNENGQLTVTSRQIAENFEREHKSVLDAIRNLTAENYAVKKLILESDDEVRGKQYPEYLLTRDGFSLLVMGFTGTKALDWKLKYIQAFNEMEKSLISGPPKLSQELQAIFAIDQRTTETNTRMDKLEGGMPLFNVECKELQALVRKTGIKALGGYKTPAYNDNSVRTKIYKDIQHQLKREFGIERYEGIKRVQLDSAKAIVNDYKAPMFLVKEIEIINDQIRF